MLKEYQYYMPGGVHEFIDWTQNFVQVGGENAPAWGLVQADLDALKAQGCQSPVCDLVVNRPGEVIAIIPNLAPGAYRVRIVTQYAGGGRPLKTPHTAVFDKVLTVV